MTIPLCMVFVESRSVTDPRLSFLTCSLKQGQLHHSTKTDYAGLLHKGIV
jgi:hypothetical protein